MTIILSPAKPCRIENNKPQSGDVSAPHKMSLVWANEEGRSSKICTELRELYKGAGKIIQVLVLQPIVSDLRIWGRQDARGREPIDVMVPRADHYMISRQPQGRKKAAGEPLSRLGII